MNLLTRVRSLFAPVLTDLAPDRSKVPDYLAMIKPAANADHGDYQANFAMTLAPLLKRTPAEVAADMVQRLGPLDGTILASAAVAASGKVAFINLKVRDALLAESVQKIATDPKLGVELPAKAKTIVIDYSSPNVAKPLHVGHIRSIIIGDSITRVLRFLGHTVVTDNHLGDWGTQFGMLIYGYRTFLSKDEYKKNPVRELARLYVQVRKVDETVELISRGYHEFRDKASYEADPVAELTRVYVNGVKRLKAASEDDEEETGKPVPNAVKTAYRTETAKLHAGDAENLKLWKEFMPECMKEIHDTYRRLGTLPFDHEHGESFYQPMLAQVVEDVQKADVAETGEGGSVIVRCKGDNVALIRKRDGAYTYTTTDLATVKYRVETWNPDAMLYVVDFRQGQHFANLFEASRRWGYTGVELTHVSFGSVMGKDRKPLKTRDGSVPELTALIDRATELGGKLFELNYWKRKANGHDVPAWDEYSDAEKLDIAQTVGVGAMKYADLSADRTKDYVFDDEKMMATDGNTATYMQYAYARCRSIFRRENIDDARFRSAPPAVLISHPAEHSLALQLLRFHEAVTLAAADYAPHAVTTYLWDLAKAYSVFFENCPVLKAETPALKESRLLLVDLVARVIKQALDLLGIRTVERM